MDAFFFTTYLAKPLPLFNVLFTGPLDRFSRGFYLNLSRSSHLPGIGDGSFVLFLFSTALGWGEVRVGLGGKR